MLLYEIKQNPFSHSKIQKIVYHGGPKEFIKFARKAHGTYISQWEDYAERYGNVIPLYVDVRNTFEPGPYAPELDAVYDRDYETVSKWLNKLKTKGYDSVKMYGDGDSLILIGDVPIVHAETGKEM